MKINSRYIVVLIIMILIILVIYINHYEYEHIATLYSNDNSYNTNDFKSLLDIELTKRLGDSFSTNDRISQLEDLIHLLTVHLKNYQNDSNIIPVNKDMSTTSSGEQWKCPNNSVSIPVPIPCPAPVPIPCPAVENKPPYFAKLGPINRHLDIGNPDTRDAWIKKKAVDLCKPNENFSILDVSAGAKPYQHLWLKAGCKYFSNEFGGNVDIVDNFRGEKQKNDLSKMHDYIGTDITNTGAPSNSFDITVLTEVLEHLPEPALAIPELVSNESWGKYLDHCSFHIW